MGHLINRRTKVLSEEDIRTISDTYHAWRTDAKHHVSRGLPKYEDVKGFCASATKERVAELDYVLIPGRYVGLAKEVDDFDFAERFTSLKAEFEAQLKEEYALNKKIISNLSKIKLSMSSQHIRWKQRFSNYTKAFYKLDEAVARIKKDYTIKDDGTIDDDKFLDDIIKECLIQRFEYTHELAWEVMKDFLEEIGNVKMYGSKDAIKEAFAADLIKYGEVWMEMIKSRNETSHTYNGKTADAIFLKVINEYHPQFVVFLNIMEEKRSGKQGNLLYRV